MNILKHSLHIFLQLLIDSVFSGITHENRWFQHPNLSI
jgi:hypothetical protein